MALKESELATMHASPASTMRSGSSAARARVVDSRSLFGGQREVRIEHNGEMYLLRMTRLGKLILTK